MFVYLKTLFVWFFFSARDTAHARASVSRKASRDRKADERRARVSWCAQTRARERSHTSKAIYMIICMTPWMHLNQISRVAPPTTENNEEHRGSPLAESTRFETHRLKNFLSLDLTREMHIQRDKQIASFSNVTGEDEKLRLPGARVPSSLHHRSLRSDIPVGRASIRLVSWQ